MGFFETLAPGEFQEVVSIASDMDMDPVAERIRRCVYVPSDPIAFV